MKRILITGAGGFVGRGLVIPFEEHDGYELRLMDIVGFATRHGMVVGDVCDPGQIEAAMRGVDALIINHMAPRGDNNANYRQPAMPFDVNVTATASLIHAAHAAGVQQVVLISSGAAVAVNPDLGLDPRLLSLRAKDYYGLTKVCQEAIAEHFARVAGMNICCLRPGYVIDGDTNTDKYGRTLTTRNVQFTDRRDIGEAARLWIERGRGFEPFAILSTPEAMTAAGARYTCERLGWKPRHDFSWLPVDEAASGA